HYQVTIAIEHALVSDVERWGDAV
ncbi:MAG: hypothetical protein QOC94_2140, partial [Actinoplanes sp.]|nr:hypothetical protein [Actinoplanes sp.]